MLDNAKKRFIQEKARFNKGYGEVSWIKGIYEVFILVFVASNVSGYSISKWFYIIVPVFVFAILWLIGYFWDKSHLFNIEAEFGNERNYFVREVRKALKSSKRKL